MKKKTGPSGEVGKCMAYERARIHYIIRLLVVYESRMKMEAVLIIFGVINEIKEDKKLERLLTRLHISEVDLRRPIHQNG